MASGKHKQIHSMLKYILMCVLIMGYIDGGQCFNVYWNVPSHNCQHFGVYINASAYGIIQNTDDLFYGDKVTIFYGPGKFPYLDKGHPIHGGIPQNGSLIDHVQIFKDEVNKKLPPDFKGVAVLDFERYYPSYHMNPPEYKAASKSWVSSMHPNWPPSKVEDEAIRTFNNSAREFFEVLLWMGRELRPHGLWGYYHYPYCHNYGPLATTCKPQVVADNDEMDWLMKGSSALYPSIYIFRNSGWTPRSRRRNARVRMMEALRVRKNTGKKTPILPYFWYRYHDSPNYLSPMDITNTLGLAKIMNLEGIVIWGATHDLDNKGKCLYFKNFLEEQLGPLVQYINRYSHSVLRRIINSRRLLKKFSETALREASLGINSNAL